MGFRCGLIEVYKAKVTTSPQCCIITRESFTTVKDNPDELALPTHPLLLVKTNIPRCHGIYSMVASYFHLNIRDISYSDTEQTRHAHAGQDGIGFRVAEQ